MRGAMGTETNLKVSLHTLKVKTDSALVEVAVPLDLQTRVPEDWSVVAP